MRPTLTSHFYSSGCQCFKFGFNKFELQDHFKPLSYGNQWHIFTAGCPRGTGETQEVLGFTAHCTTCLAHSLPTTNWLALNTHIQRLPTTPYVRLTHHLQYWYKLFSNALQHRPWSWLRWRTRQRGSSTAPGVLTPHTCGTGRKSRVCISPAFSLRHATKRNT